MRDFGSETRKIQIRPGPGYFSRAQKFVKMAHVNRHHLSLSSFLYNSTYDTKIQMLAEITGFYINMKSGKFMGILILL